MIVSREIYLEIVGDLPLKVVWVPVGMAALTFGQEAIVVLRALTGRLSQLAGNITLCLQGKCMQ